MKYSFWKLLNENEIQIPIIQRDYAQGRTEEHGIAKDFIVKIKQKLDANKQLNLDFVYGKNLEKKFIPLDGQQRLTTLFLLHWYISVKEESLQKFNGNEVRRTLSKFTYETRTSSQDFCNDLCVKSLDFLDINITISSQIRNQKWYYLSWENDPTIKAMLNMLDVIDKFFKKEEISYYEKLFGDKPLITFNYLPLDEFKLSDELYIKMNSRGKPLTDFENFKSEFSSMLHFTEKSKMDNEWYDIFWNLEKDKKEPSTIEVDKRFYNFFENITLNFFVENHQIDKKSFDNFNLIDDYSKVYNDKTQYLTEIITCLNSLIGFDDTFNYFLKSTNNVSEISYWDRLRFYALTRFFVQRGPVHKSNYREFLNWMRVCRNLINNTLIQSVDQYQTALRSIKQLSSHIGNLYKFVVNMETLPGFLDMQQQEEKLKANLIIKDSENWEEIISAIEENRYFDGQIGFILDYSKVDGEYNSKLFMDYSQKLDFLFEHFQQEEDYLFQRALFAIGDYLIDIRTSKTFCTFDENLRSKMDTWRKVFNDPIKTLYLKELLNRVHLSTLSEDLTEIVKNCKYQDWKKYFVHIPKIIRSCSNNQIRIQNDIISLARSSADNWQVRAELYSYVLYLKHFSKNSTSPFQYADYFNSAYQVPCVYLKDYKTLDDNNYELDIFWDKGFKLCFYDSNKRNPSQIKNNYLSKFSYDSENDQYWLHTDISDIDVIYEEINKFCSEFK